MVINNYKLPVFNREFFCYKIDMILLIGSSGYIGSKFSVELAKRDLSFTTVFREQCKYDSLLNIIESNNNKELF